MDCNVIKDLIPLYIDGCCSEESARLVREHITSCDACKKLLEEMQVPSDLAAVPKAPTAMTRVNDWKASVLQSVLLFFSFALVAFGVALEAQTPVGPTNGFWALNLIVPATGFMLSLVNWYFVRLYRSGRSFANASLAATLGVTVCAYLWAWFHYGVNPFGPAAAQNAADQLIGSPILAGLGIILTAAFCILSKVLSCRYAEMLGKE